MTGNYLVADYYLSELQMDMGIIFFVIYGRKTGKVLTNYTTPGGDVISKQRRVRCGTCWFIEAFGLFMLPNLLVIAFLSTTVHFMRNGFIIH